MKRAKNKWEYKRQSSTDSIEENQLIWYGHVQRMGQDRLPKKTMRRILREHRKKGRPKKTWIEPIRRSMSDRGPVSYTHLDVYKRQTLHTIY